MSVDLKKEDEVKEYINNLGIEYRFGCYQEKNPEVCHLLGDYLEAIKKDYDKASTVYRNNCDEYNFGKSCLKYGNYTLLGKGKDKGNVVEALKYFEKGCQLNEPTACLHAGLILTANNVSEIKPDISKGMKYLRKSCEENIDGACYYLSGMYLGGIRKHDPNYNPHKPNKDAKVEYLMPINLKEAFKYAEKACSLRNMYACANLSRMYAKGDGVAKDEVKSQEYKKIALEIQDEMKNAKELKFQRGLEN